MKNSQCFGLPSHVIHHLNEIFRNHKAIHKVILYGSRALGRHRLGSDIDLCIDSDSLTLMELLSIENEIDDLLLPWKVDLSIRNKIDNPELLKHIESIGVEVFPTCSFYFS